MNIQIKKAKLRDGKFLEATYVQRDGDSTDEFTRKSNEVVHDDLLNAFRNLSEYVTTASEQYDKDGTLDTVSVIPIGFTLSGSGDNETITVSAKRHLTDGSVLNFNTPNTKREEIDDDTNVLIDACTAEVLAFLRENKHAPSRIQPLFGDDLETEISIDADKEEVL